MNLEDRFHREMLRIYDEAKEFGYYPTYFSGDGDRPRRSLGSQTPARRH